MLHLVEKLGRFKTFAQLVWKECCCFTLKGSKSNNIVFVSKKHSIDWLTKRTSTLVTMIWLIVTEYISHTWARICSVCRNHNQVLSSFMTCHWVCIKSRTTGTTSGTGTAYPSGTPEFTVTLATPKVVWIRQIRCWPSNSWQIYRSSISFLLQQN